MEVVMSGWVKSSRSHGNGNCVEVAPCEGGVMVRDSKQNDMGVSQPVLFFTADEWTAFLDGVRKGEFDDLAEAPDPIVLTMRPEAADCAYPGGERHDHVICEAANATVMCHNQHPFVPGVDVDDPGNPDPSWCNECGEARVAEAAVVSQ